MPKIKAKPESSMCAFRLPLDVQAALDKIAAAEAKKNPDVTNNKFSFNRTTVISDLARAAFGKLKPDERPPTEKWLEETGFTKLEQDEQGNPDRRWVLYSPLDNGLEEVELTIRQSGFCWLAALGKREEEWMHDIHTRDQVTRLRTALYLEEK